MAQATKELSTQQKSNKVFEEDDFASKKPKKEERTPMISEKTKREVLERFDLFVKEQVKS